MSARGERFDAFMCEASRDLLASGSTFGDVLKSLEKAKELADALVRAGYLQSDEPQ